MSDEPEPPDDWCDECDCKLGDGECAACLAAVEYPDAIDDDSELDDSDLEDDSSLIDHAANLRFLERVVLNDNVHDCELGSHADADALAAAIEGYRSLARRELTTPPDESLSRQEWLDDHGQRCGCRWEHEGVRPVVECLYHTREREDFHKVIARLQQRIKAADKLADAAASGHGNCTCGTCYRLRALVTAYRQLASPETKEKCPTN